METCGIISDIVWIGDKTGCIKPEGHNDEHICLGSDGKYYCWEDDYNCTCGCWDEWEESSGMEGVCKVYNELSPEKVAKYIKK